MPDISSLPPVKIETAASMQEQLARRDHRIAFLESVCAAQKYRITMLEAREGALGSPMPAPAQSELGPAIDPRSAILCRAIAADTPLDAYARR